MLNEKILLAGDIGGTKTHIALFAGEEQLQTPLKEKIYKSAQYTCLEQILKEFLSTEKHKIDYCCLGIAGPVLEGRSSITNLPWHLDEIILQEKLGIKRVKLINDLAATAYGIPLIADEDLHTIQEGRKNVMGTKAVIAPGTGLGEAFLMPHGKNEFIAYDSEGGHVDFAPTDHIQIRLLQFMLEEKKLDHVSYEYICSGKGLPNIYEFLKYDGMEEQEFVSKKLAEADDPTPIIVNTALGKDYDCPLCKETLNIFISVLGAEAGNLALKTMAFGGVYIGGGIIPRIIDAVDSDTFRKAFLNKGRSSDMLASVPVHVILNQQTALLGAAKAARELSISA